jgi:hypothetical protein
MKYIVVLSLLFCFGCITDADPVLPTPTTENCLTTKHAPVETAIIPATATINQTISITIQYIVFDGCGGFNNIVETNNNNIKTLQVNAKYQGCSCFQALQSLVTTYNITFTTPGTKTIKFLQPDNSFLTYSINIQ